MFCCDAGGVCSTGGEWRLRCSVGFARVAGGVEGEGVLEGESCIWLSSPSERLAIARDLEEWVARWDDVVVGPGRGGFG